MVNYSHINRDECSPQINTQNLEQQSVSQAWIKGSMDDKELYYFPK